ncbi:MAG: hypothetical protein QW273_03380 [Candidatus Pacearchaeota archaeon]
MGVGEGLIEKLKIAFSIVKYGKPTKKLEEVPVKKERTDKIEYKRVYEGLRLIEKEVYAGPTSIKYWM